MRKFAAAQNSLAGRMFVTPSLDPGDFKMAYTGSEEITKPRFESRHSVEFKLQEDSIQTRKLSWLHAPDSGSKLL